MAAAVDATVTLVHTIGVEIYGSGGLHVNSPGKAELVGYAPEQVARLQQDVGTNAEVIIDSGNVPAL